MVLPAPAWARSFRKTVEVVPPLLRGAGGGARRRDAHAIGTWNPRTDVEWTSQAIPWRRLYLDDVMVIVDLRGARHSVSGSVSILIWPSLTFCTPSMPSLTRVGEPGQAHCSCGQCRERRGPLAIDVDPPLFDRLVGGRRLEGHDVGLLPDRFEVWLKLWDAGPSMPADDTCTHRGAEEHQAALDCPGLCFRDELFFHIRRQAHGLDAFDVLVILDGNQNPRGRPRWICDRPPGISRIVRRLQRRPRSV